ncbi:signal peptidase I [Cohnella sp. CIP 111063]|uniref:signal peptidase I n=1 Tax=unclassified Cohnella TaxID=2636738 RepID=UPI000B8C6D91|nr:MULTISPECIES: signal peptidase I [unclassified Cohnella]OXS55012.1 signal peptidase I [Cohnella sp. CIP 111063]PRX65145.1 signal peptidase I [Cohnella sp. SGD-V74]
MDTIVRETEQEILNSSGKKNEAKEWIKALLTAAIVLFLIQKFLFMPYAIEGPSMFPTFKTGERIVVNKLIFDLRSPKRGEIVVLRSPEGRTLIKRIIGLPGDRIQLKNNLVYINGEVLVEPYLQSSLYDKAENGIKMNRDYSQYLVPDNKLFVLGDNRLHSQDSRALGAISLNEVIGRADLVIWPINQVRFVQHNSIRELEL